MPFMSLWSDALGDIVEEVVSKGCIRIQLDVLNI